MPNNWLLTLRKEKEMKNFSIYALVLTMLTACVTAAPIKQTASGRPEAVFRSQSVEQLTGRISRVCLERGMQVTQGKNELTCSKVLSGSDAILATLAIGNSYSSTPTQSIKFNFIKQGKDTRIYAYQWIQTQMALGQIRRHELNSGKHFNDVQNFLKSLGGV